MILDASWPQLPPKEMRLARKSIRKRLGILRMSDGARNRCCSGMSQDTACHAVVIVDRLDRSPS